MKSFIKTILIAVIVFLTVNILQDAIFWTIEKAQEPYRVELEKVEQELAKIESLLEEYE